MSYRHSTHVTSRTVFHSWASHSHIFKLFIRVHFHSPWVRVGPAGPVRWHSVRRLYRSGWRSLPLLDENINNSTSNLTVFSPLYFRGLIVVGHEAQELGEVAQEGPCRTLGGRRETILQVFMETILYVSMTTLLQDYLETSQESHIISKFLIHFVSRLIYFLSFKLFVCTLFIPT